MGIFVFLGVQFFMLLFPWALALYTEDENAKLQAEEMFFYGIYINGPAFAFMIVLLMYMEDLEDYFLNSEYAELMPDNTEWTLPITWDDFFDLFSTI